MINSGDTAWILAATALVMLMTIPGLVFFYGGLVRRKNVLSIMMQSFFILALITVQWMVFGYSLAFGPDIGHLIGGLKWWGLFGVGSNPNPDYAATIPQGLFMIFQMMFAVITPALITGAFAERMKFTTFALFTFLWATLVYDPLAHWVWGMGGWLRNMGTLDFAGGIVVHISSGVAALVCALMLGRRRGYPEDPTPPHNLPFTILGAGLLWFGWFGFNAGSALAANGLAVSAFIATNAGAAAGALAWMIMDLIFSGRPTILGLASGAIAGLATVTPASGFVGPFSALAIGAAAGIVCYLAVSIIKTKLGYDDSLDAFGIHGVGGFTGTVLLGLLAEKAINSAGNNGWFFGNQTLFFTQLMAASVGAVYSFVVTFVLLKLLDMTLGLRVENDEEVIGLDITQHKESAYTLMD